MSRVLRGGSWGNLPIRQRVFFRYYIGRHYRLNYFGFRLVLGGVL